MCDELALKAMSISGTQRWLRLVVFSRHHNDKEDVAFVPAAELAYSPIVNMIAQ